MVLAAAAFETPPGVSAHHANTPGKQPAPPTTALIRGCFGGVLARSQLQFGRSQGILDGLRWQLGLEIFTLHLSFFGVPNIDFCSVPDISRTHGQTTFFLRLGPRKGDLRWVEVAVGSGLMHIVFRSAIFGLPKIDFGSVLGISKIKWLNHLLVL